MPNVQFSGESYQVTGSKATASAVIGYIRMFLFALMFMGDTILSMFGPSPPDFLKDVVGYLSNNKMQAGMMLFFVGSMIQAQLM